MKARERFNKILLACRDRIQDEVSALIGKTIKLGDVQFRQVSKEELFAEAEGKQVLAHVRLEGEIQGDGCLLIGIKDAIYIGGTLIMLPESELQSVLAAQQYSEELEDSFGEVANIICGAATVTFEEQYPKNVRMIRMEQEVIVPVKVVAESDQPVADIPYYLMAAPLQLEERELGVLHLVLPAEPFGLVEENVKEMAEGQPSASVAPSPAQEEHAEKDTPEPDKVLKGEADEASKPEEIGVLERPMSEKEDTAQPTTVQPAQSRRDVGKQKKLIDDLLQNSMVKMSEEVSALLGGTLKIVPEENKALTKEQFLDQAGGKQIMSRMDLRGSGEGEAYLFVEVRAAVYLGGALIMLPESELEETARNEEFGDDARDAYGEVTNIIAGVYTAVFEEQYRAKIGFVKTSMEPVVPLKVDPDSDDVFVNQGYYFSTGQIQYNNRDLGRLQLLVPAHVLELEELFQVADEPLDTVQSKKKAPEATPAVKTTAAVEPARLREKQEENATILFFTDDDDEASRIAHVLEEMGYVSRILHFKDPVNSVLTPRIQMVFLVMREASEQGFGVAIKISSAGLPVPLVAAGPAWTRTMVLKAVKYGACDILVTPSLSDDIRQKIEVNLLKKAA
jgi:chemotaxis protein CheY-P-specific phosphatase CheC